MAVVNGICTICSIFCSCAVRSSHPTLSPRNIYHTVGQRRNFPRRHPLFFLTPLKARSRTRVSAYGPLRASAFSASMPHIMLTFGVIPASMLPGFHSFSSFLILGTHFQAHRTIGLFGKADGGARCTANRCGKAGEVVPSALHSISTGQCCSNRPLVAEFRSPPLELVLASTFSTCLEGRVESSRPPWQIKA
jgi:hypothetical protein